MTRSDRYFSQHARGGAIASRIESQDSAAAILCIEALSGSLQGVPQPTAVENVVLYCEGLEDLEFNWPSGRLFVSVKDQLLTMSLVRSHLESIAKHQNYLAAPDDERILLCGLRGCDSQVSSFIEDRQHLAARVLHSEAREAIDEFEKKWRVPSWLAIMTTIDDRDMRRDSAQAQATFATAMRSAFPLTSCTDRHLSVIREDLAALTFAPARRQRNALPLYELYLTLLERLAPDEIALVQSEFQSTPFGYLHDPDLANTLRSERSIVLRARRRALRAWRRHTFVERLTPRIGCLVCNHPMMGALNGRSGYVCPQCNYVPFGTLFYACDCGQPLLLVSQPEIEGVGLFGQAISAARESARTCDKCSSVVDERRLDSRLFWLPILWPLEGSVDSRLIYLRESMGRPDRKFTPEEARAYLLESRQAKRLVHFPSAAEMPRFAPGTLFWMIVKIAVVTIVLWKALHYLHWL